MGILSVNWKHANQKIDVFPKFSFNPYLYLTYVWSISWISPRSWWHLLKARSASCPMLTCDGAHGMSTIHVDPGLICQALVSQTDPKWKCLQVVLGQWDLCRIQDGWSHRRPTRSRPHLRGTIVLLPTRCPSGTCNLDAQAFNFRRHSGCEPTRVPARGCHPPKALWYRKARQTC